MWLYARWLWTAYYEGGLGQKWMEDVGNTWACLHHEIWSGDLLTAITSDVILKKNEKKPQSLIIQNKLTSQFHFYVSFYMQACLVLTCVSLSLSACRHWRSCHVHHASCTRNTGLTTSSHYQLSIIKWMFCFLYHLMTNSRSSCLLLCLSSVIG